MAVVSSRSHPKLALICTTSEAPAVVRWGQSKNSVVNFYQDSDEIQIVHSLKNGVTATYESTLTFSTTPQSHRSLLLCEATSTYISSDGFDLNIINTLTGTMFGYEYIMEVMFFTLVVYTSFPLVRAYAGLFSVGYTSFSINCFGGNSWIDEDGTVLVSTSTDTVSLIFDVATDDLHDRVYTCTNNSVAVANLKLFIIGESGVSHIMPMSSML